MVVAYALLLASTVAPAEIDAAGLARILAAQNGGEAVVALVNGRTVLTDETGTADVISADMKKRNVRFIPGPVAIAHAEILPDAAIQTVARLRKPDPARKPEEIAFPPTALSGGKVTYATEAGKSITLASLVQVKWSLPLALSPAFVNDLAMTDLAVNVKDLDEASFLRSVAKAIGGRYRTDGKNLIIEPNGSEIRTRALRAIDLAIKAPRDKTSNDQPATMQLTTEEGEAVEVVAIQGEPMRGGRRTGAAGGVATSPQGFAAQLELARAVTAIILPKNFERFYDGEIEQITIDLAGQQGTQTALIKLLRANAGNGPGANQVNRLLATVPPTAPGQIVLGNGYSIDASLNTVDRRGNPSRAIRLKAL